MNKVSIVAEIAQGYEGKPELADLLTTAALRSGADIIKYQLVYADELVTPDYKHHALFSSLEMDLKVWKGLRDRIRKENKLMYVDLYGQKSLEVALEIGVDGVKLSTTDFYNDQLREDALQSFSNILISIGGIPISDVDRLVDELLKQNLNNSKQITLLYGFQAEPTPLEQNNLAKIRRYKERYSQFEIGFMDHSDGGAEDGVLLSLLAMGVGISMIEKHITLDRELEIEDYVSGLTPSRFMEFTRIIRKFQVALGSDSLDTTRIEDEYRVGAAKVVVARRMIQVGQTIQRDDLILKRSGESHKGETYNHIDRVIGQSTSCVIEKDEPVFVESLCEF
jgi:N,N'-diacetyllegionaminate synthase